MALRADHVVGRCMTELSIGQLDVLEDYHLQQLRTINEARMAAVRVNERSRLEAQIEIARQFGRFSSAR